MPMPKNTKVDYGPFIDLWTVLHIRRFHSRTWFLQISKIGIIFRRRMWKIARRWAIFQVRRFY